MRRCQAMCEETNLGSRRQWLFGTWMAGFLMAVLVSETMVVAADAPPIENVVLGVHGGTGMEKAKVTPELDKQLRAGLTAALQAGYARLQQKEATSLDAVEAAIRVLEDDPLFNAGRGAVFTRDGKNELDASIMEGSGKRAGAVAGVTVVRNPISAARAVMEKSPHVLLIGPGADVFAREQKLEIVDPKFFYTERRWNDLQEALKEERKKEGHGTVGAVAVDAKGVLAAGTSTGGMTKKRSGRVGDSPIIGAGTYADNEGCAVSATGHGEYFIRWSVAHDINALVSYKGLGVQAAADVVIQDKLKPAGGEGAVIALDPKGRFAMSYNSEGLYRGYITRDGKVAVHLYED
jgi:L-asparaginase / beta-aspartyl-peptidase